MLQFLYLLNTSLMTCKLHTAWKQAIICPILKHSNLKSLRPISSISCLDKTMEKIILARLKYKIPNLHPNLLAFIRKRGTSDNIASLRSSIDKKMSYLILLDLEKTFELADPPTITTSLADKGIKGKLLGWIEDYLIERKASVHFQGHTSMQMHFQKDTPKGGILSPTLFNILVEQLVNPFKSNIKLFAYADDLQLVATGSSRFLNAHSQDMIASKCNLLGIKINPTKTAALFISQNKPNTTLNIEGQQLQWVESAICLGHTFASGPHFKLQLKYIKQRT